MNEDKRKLIEELKDFDYPLPKDNNITNGALYLDSYTVEPIFSSDFVDVDSDNNLYIKTEREKCGEVVGYLFDFKLKENPNTYNLFITRSCCVGFLIHFRKIELNYRWDSDDRFKEHAIYQEAVNQMLSSISHYKINDSLEFRHQCYVKNELRTLHVELDDLQDSCNDFIESFSNEMLNGSEIEKEKADKVLDLFFSKIKHEVYAKWNNC